MTYDDLGGVGIPPAYVLAIANDCTKCPARMGELCRDEHGRDRKRPHGSRMVVRTGWSDETEETS